MDDLADIRAIQPHSKGDGCYNNTQLAICAMTLLFLELLHPAVKIQPKIFHPCIGRAIMYVYIIMVVAALQ